MTANYTFANDMHSSDAKACWDFTFFPISQDKMQLHK